MYYAMLMKFQLEYDCIVLYYLIKLFSSMLCYVLYDCFICVSIILVISVFQVVPLITNKSSVNIIQDHKIMY